MKKRTIFIICFLSSSAFIGGTQQIFIYQVSVDYVKTVALRALSKEMFPEWAERFGDRMPANVVSIYNFTGDGNKSIFKRIKEPEITRNVWVPNLGDQNIVYNDYTSGTTTTQKPIYEETFLIQDSLLNIKWKLTSDTRDIAGFSCRKAIGILYDSIAVFAFYSDEIMISGGPEGINGLPGLILGVGIPRLHITWFADKISINGVNMKSVVPATKGKKTNRADMIKSLRPVLKRWDEYGEKLLLAYII